MGPLFVSFFWIKIVLPSVGSADGGVDDRVTEVTPVAQMKVTEWRPLKDERGWKRGGRWRTTKNIVRKRR